MNAGIASGEAVVHRFACGMGKMSVGQGMIVSKSKSESSELRFDTQDNGEELYYIAEDRIWQRRDIGMKRSADSGAAGG